MKRIYFAAGALLLGSSAFAWAPSTTPAADAGKPAAVAAVKTPPPKVVPKPQAKLATSAVKAEAASASWIADDQVLAETTPQPAAGNYPPCRPGPGDDHCIQLYERGVRAELASWDRPTGTLAANSATDAVGGPYEPVDTTLAGAMGGGSTYTGMGGPEEPVDATLAMNGDGSVDAAIGEIAADEGAAASYTGVGGPLEEVATTDYPPCRPGPGDDRCIQLYERGVTGR
ncbi:MAG TPA: hypothetical protein VGW40_11800 [Allosphingosinicella sp.]|nr:hypothetical protein [Allosphingosinicella sp.]